MLQKEVALPRQQVVCERADVRRLFPPPMQCRFAYLFVLSPSKGGNGARQRRSRSVAIGVAQSEDRLEPGPPLSNLPWVCCRRALLSKIGGERFRRSGDVVGS